MAVDDESPTSELPERFVTTRWSLVQRASGADTRAKAALETLCSQYWFPLYHYVRRRGHGHEDARDLTQEFFARLLEAGWINRADETKGRFRTFLLTAMQRFLANAYRKQNARKRGSGSVPLPIQCGDADTRYGVEPADLRTPEQAYERSWAVTLLDTVLNKLETEMASEGRADVFTQLKPCLLGDSPSQPYEELAGQLHMQEGAIRVVVHRLRQRYRKLLREEILQTLANPEELQSEMQHLFSVLSQKENS